VPVLDLVNAVPVRSSPRVMQLLGLFGIPPSERSEERYSVHLPVEGRDWHVGLIVGPSGSGKSTLARAAFGDRLVTGFDWPADHSILDAFPAGLGIRDITEALSSVGFSSPPSWLRPYRCLSTGEQFRATLARAVSESPGLTAVDEFTSTVDRTVARVASAAVAKAVRRSGGRLVAVTCHYDVIDWLDPDWLCEMPGGEFSRRSLRGRPKVNLEVCRVHPSTWQLFRRHHYLSGSLHRAARCFAALWGGRPVAFASALPWPHAVNPGWREHRTVCLPDFQGVGIGNALSEYVASLFAATGRPYFSTTANPAMVRQRARSPLWLMVRRPGLVSRLGRSTSKEELRSTTASSRVTAGFRYVGPGRPDDARGLGVIR
jgi:GNAT superfamily N-acetyltransferase